MEIACLRQLRQRWALASQPRRCAAKGILLSIFSKMCLWWLVAGPAVSDKYMDQQLCTVSNRLPAEQVRAQCVAQFLALRAAGALPPDIDQTIRNLYWCAGAILL